MTTEMTQQVVTVHEAADQDRLLDANAQAPQQAGVGKKGHHAIKPCIALFQLALAVVLFGLLAYQANSTSQDPVDPPSASGANGTAAKPQSSGNASSASGNATGASVGFNAAGDEMFIFGLAFAVLQAVTAYTMWLHLTFFLPSVKHSSVVGPLKVTAAVGFIAMGFACRHINLHARENTSMEHLSITHAIEAFIIINWFFTILVLSLSMHTTLNWDCENEEAHKLTRRLFAGHTQFVLSLVLIGLLSGYFQLYTEGLETMTVTKSTEMLLVFAILFAVLQGISGIAMIQQCGSHAPGQMGETVPALLKVVNSFGVIAFGFSCRSIYLSSQSSPAPPAHLIAIESFVIINFFFGLFLAYASVYNHLNWDNNNTTEGKRHSGHIFGGLQVVFSIVLFGLLAAVFQGLTAQETGTVSSLNAAGVYMVWFGLLFSVLQFFAGLTMHEIGSKKLGGLNPSSVLVTNKVALAVGALAFGFACRHINLFDRKGSSGSDVPLVHAIESFIIINFFLTWLIDILSVKGKIEW